MINDRQKLCMIIIIIYSHLFSFTAKSHHIDVLLFNLLACDLLVATFGTIFPLISSMSKEWIFGVLFCEIYAFVMSLMGEKMLITFVLDNAIPRKKSAKIFRCKFNYNISCIGSKMIESR